MIRQERRFKLREYTKELQKLKTNKDFLRVLNDKRIASLTPQEYELLKDYKHEDKELQAKFNFGRLMLAKVKELTDKINKLKYPVKDATL